MTALAVPLEVRTKNVAYDMDDGDIDAEGEEVEEELEEPVGDEEEAESSDASAEAESGEEDEDAEDEDDEEEDEDKTVPAPKTRKSVKVAASDEEISEEASDAEESGASEDDESEESSGAESVTGEKWQDGSDAAETTSLEVANRNNCIFCQQTEEQDPSEEFEEYLACSVCGDNSHRKCARDAKSLKPRDDVSHWRCPTCLDNDLEPSSPGDEPAVKRRRRSSPSRIARDLLPQPRGGSRPGSHSVFNTLILDDDPLDGSRSLRKRKASSEQQEEAKKRPRQQSVHSELAANLAAAGILPGGRLDEPEPEPEEAEEVEVDAGSTSTRKSRPSRSHKSKRLDRGEHNRRSASVVKQDSTSLVLRFPVNPEKLATLLRAKPKRKKARPRESTVEIQRERDRPVPSFTSHYATPFYAFHERENDELKSKPYGGVLSEADADTSKTLPLKADREHFNEARQKAEEEWKLKAATSEPEPETKRTQKLAGPPSKIKCVNFGGYEIETWYAAPYPEEYSRNRILYICEFCLKYMNSDFVAWRHKLKCPAKHPPGDEIYRDRSISVFEVDGRKNPVYCQNLCLLAKLFLGSKTLYYDVEPFLFYVMTEFDDFGCHFVGYFSKEKRPSSQNNVSCILTLPTHQRKGYGNLLISFSYLLTRVEGKTGSPEKPLSDMGLVSYRNYWRLVLSYELIDQKEPLSILELSERTGMTADDIVAALEGLRALVRDPVTKSYALRLDYDYFRQCIEEWEAKQYVTLDPRCLVWTPYIMGRGNLAHYETAPPLPTVAPREDEEENKDVAPEEGVQQTTKADAIAAHENAIMDGDETQLMVNGNASDSSKQSHSKDHENIDPAMSQLIGSTPIPPASSITPIEPQTSPKPNGIPKTPAPQVTPSIPPIRYEVFPPIPGTNVRRRGGWRGGPRRHTANGSTTPNATPTTARRRRRTGFGQGTGNRRRSGKGQKGNASATARRTRLSSPTDKNPETTKDLDVEDDAHDDVRSHVDEPVLTREDMENEQDAEGDDVMEDVEDEVAADDDFQAEDAEESEAESEDEAPED